MVLAHEPNADGPGRKGRVAAYVRTDAVSDLGPVIAALAAGDAARFQAVPGIGKRTAERIIVELREKVGAAGGEDAPARMPIIARRGEPMAPRALAREGLLELGYGSEEAEELLAGAEGDSAEDLLGAALRLARAPS